MNCLKPDNRLKNIVEAAAKRKFYTQHWQMSANEAINLITQNKYEDIPLLRKQDISRHWNDLIEYGDFVDVVSSSGTTGRPVDLPVHRLQEQLWVDCVARGLTELGAKPGFKLLHLLSNNDMFTLGPLIWLAAKKVGLGSFRCTALRARRVADVINYHSPEFVVGNPMVMLNIAETLGSDFPSKEKLPKFAYLAACATFDANNKLTPLAEKTKAVWGLEKILAEYGCSEVGSIGHECLAHQSFHIHDDAIFVELIDPHTGKPPPPGRPGEVVITSLTLPRGFIAVRYATGDIAAWIDYSPCPCGRRSPRLGTIIGRADQQLKVLGQTVYPDLIFNVTDQLSEIEDSVLVKYRDELDAEHVELWLSSRDGHDEAVTRCKSLLDQHLAVTPRVRRTSSQTISRVRDKHLERSNGVKIPRYISVENISQYLLEEELA